MLAAYYAAKEGNNAHAREVLHDMAAVGGGEDAGRYGAHTIHEYSGYINIGPPRPPFSWGLRDPEDDARAVASAKKQSQKWLALCDKYRPEVEARQKTLAAV